MYVTYILQGERGAMYRIRFSKNHADLGGGVYVSIAKQAKDGEWKELTGNHIEANDVSARVLADWLREL